MGDIPSNSSAYTSIAEDKIKLKMEMKVPKNNIYKLFVVSIILILGSYV
jgi:hypothetical protein